MDVTVQDILKILISVFVTGGGLLWWLNRPKQKKEIANIVGDTYYKMTERLQEEIALLDQRMQRNRDLISQLEKSDKAKDVAIKALRHESEECKYQHIVKELEFAQLKKHNQFTIWQRDMVFVIDDDIDVLDDFRHKFAKTEFLDYKGFEDVDIFLREVNEAKPPIVVLDYNVGLGKTAKDIIQQMAYTPEIFIMSGLKEYEKKFEGMNIKFFHKDDRLYVYKIAAEIIKHLTQKT